MNGQKIIKKLVLLGMSFLLLARCGASGSAPKADRSYTQTDITKISVPSDTKVVGLGEAGHGVKEYHEMKAEVFKALVKNKGCRTFIIEGDFGGSLKVDQYINGGTGTAKEALSEVGYGIYRSEELAALVDWMRTYNDGVPKEKALHFYGFDVQRFDNNKEILFSVIDQSHPELREEFSGILDQLTDDKYFSYKPGDFKTFKEGLAPLVEKMDALEADIVDASGREAFDFARECAKTLYACCHVNSEINSNPIRDQYMFEKVQWFMDRGDGSLLFINGHNGHMGQQAVAGYKCMGELLDENLGPAYYAIGTDAQVTEFNSASDDGFDVVTVQNTNGLNTQFSGSEDQMYWIDFKTASADEAWNQIISSTQRVSTLNSTVGGFMTYFKFFYTTKFVPDQMFDAMIIFQKVSPTTIFEKP